MLTKLPNNTPYENVITSISDDEALPELRNPTKEVGGLFTSNLQGEVLRHFQAATGNGRGIRLSPRRPSHLCAVKITACIIQLLAPEVESTHVVFLAFIRISMQLSCYPRSLIGDLAPGDHALYLNMPG